MPSLRFKDTVPNGGWRFLETRTGLNVEGESFGHLRDQVIAHRSHRGLDPIDPPTVEQEIETQLCGRLGDRECKGIPGDGWVPVRSAMDIFDMEKIVAFSASAWEWVKTGGKLVPIEESERRAVICRGCPANSSAGQGCMKCGVNKLVLALVPGDRMTEGVTLCLYCGCDLRAKVLAPDSVIVESDRGRGIEYPPHCWQRHILEAHKSLPSPAPLVQR